MKKILCLCFCLFVNSAANAGLIFVDSWHVGDGPVWSAAAQTAYSGQEAAAFLFGGNPGDYSISTISNQVADINNMAWMDTQGGDIDIYAEDFENGDVYIPGVSSAFILDHSCDNRYEDPSSECTDQYINYAFREDSVSAPEPASLGLLGFGLVAIGFARKRKAA